MAYLSLICMRSKAHWGYDEHFLRQCLDDLTFTKSELADTDIACAVVGERPAGVAQISMSGGEACLWKLFIDPPYMGTGLGSLLFDWAVAVSKRKGAFNLTLDADPFAASFYEHKGARREGVAPSTAVPGRLLPRYIFRLQGLI
ncbi:MAG: GNAT family N-acetyltransferase [Magnetovibrionaceae bacterium]